MKRLAKNNQARKADPMLTKNGNVRLGPLNLNQLQQLLEKTPMKKKMAKIQRRIDLLKHRLSRVESVVPKSALSERWPFPTGVEK